MKIMVEIGHPAHVHHFKNMIWELEKHGYEVKIVAKDKDVTLELLGAYGFKYEMLGRNYNGLLNKAYGLIKVDYRLFKIAKKFKPDLFVSRASPHSAHVSRLVNRPHIAFCDTEHATLSDMIAYPFTDVICTPLCYKKRLNPKKHVKFDGYKELAYLHPNYFKPDSSVLADLGLDNDDKFVVIRFVSWKASHDLGDSGFENTREVVDFLEQYGRVLITSEAKLPPELKKFKITIPPEKIHHLLYFADLYVGESATMATESVILGTPAIFVSTSRRGYTDELEYKHGLVYTFSNPKTMQKNALEKALELLESRDLKKEWEKRRVKMLSEKIDVTKFMTEFIENYPESLYEYERKVK